MSCPLGHGEPTSDDPTEAEVYYQSYLQLDKLLNAQSPVSTQKGSSAHEEMLFIIIHQTYELWFKQILHEIDSVLDIFNRDFVEESNLNVVVQRLTRVVEIQKILIDQVKVLETMTPMEFLDFRNFITPASGFQSLQFRLIENKLGVPRKHRIKYQSAEYTKYFHEKERKVLEDMEGHPTLVNSVERWLERTPFVNTEDFTFWEEYRRAVDMMLEEEKHMILSNQLLSEETKQSQIQSHLKNVESFNDMFNVERYNEQRSKGLRRFSHEACQAALFIYLYRDHPVLHLPFRVLTLLTEIDEGLITWRFRHVTMVQRMIGVKLGTGGSSGYYYLKSTVSDRYKVFLDLYLLSTYLIPRSRLPPLSAAMKQRMGFNYLQELLPQDNQSEDKK